MERGGVPVSNQVTPTAITPGSRLYLLHKKVSGIAHISISIFITIPAKDSVLCTTKSNLKKKLLDKTVDLTFVEIDTSIEYLILKLKGLQTWLFARNQKYHGVDIKRLTSATED